MAETINLGKVLVTLEGEHDSTRSYDKYCEVTSGGSSFVSKRDVPIGTPITDTAYWQKRASKGADGTNGVDGNDGEDAYQPFKGWYSSTSELNTSFGTPQVGDYAYVKGATANDPVAIYQCATAGTWTDSGRTFNPANNQEFASGQSLNTVNIVDDLNSSSSTDVLSAKQGNELKGQITQAAGGNISGNMLLYKKILYTGVVADATGASNRTLEVDVEYFVGQTLYLSGVNYAYASSVNHYCWWVIYDANGNMLDKSAINTTAESIRHINEPLVMPEGAKTLYVQGSAVEGSIIPSAQSPYIRDIVNEHTEEIEEIQESLRIVSVNNIVNSPNSTLNYSISASDGTWHVLNIVGSYVFNVLAGETYRIKANDNKRGHCHLLTSATPVAGATPSYMSGTEEIIIPEGESAIVDVPQDGFMLIIREYYNAGNGDYLPTSIYKISYIQDAVVENSREIEGLKETVTNNTYVPIKYSILSQKKITKDGQVVDAGTATNRTLLADVTDYVGKTLLLDGILYRKTSAANDYCWYVFQDADNNVVEKSNTSDSAASKYYTNEPIVVPVEAVKLYVQGSAVNGLPKAQCNISSVVETIVNSGSDALVDKTTRTFKLDFGTLKTTDGRVATSANYTNDACRHTIDYIKIHKSIEIKNLQNTTVSIRILYYDKDYTLISTLTYQDTENGITSIVLNDIPSDAVWFRIHFAIDSTNYPNRVKYPRFEVEIESEWGDGEETSKEPYIEYQPFIYSVKSNIPIKLYEHSYSTKSVFGFDEGLIHLPPTYTPKGTPTPLIFFIHGDAERYTIGESSFSGHMKMQQCWSDAGFAQVDLDLIPSYLNTPNLASTGGSRDDLECISAAWKWIINHYNIDTTGFYLIGRSRGGQCVLEVLGKGGAVKLPIIAAISMAGANSIFEYSVYSNATEAEYQLWCNAHGLPTEGRPSWEQSPVYATSKSFLKDPDIYNFVSNNFDLWSKKALTGWGLVNQNLDNITPRNYFDNFIYPYVQAGSVTNAIETFFQHMLDTMQAKSPVPLRLDWCYGDQTQSKEYYVSSPHSYSTMFSEMLLNSPASNVEYRRWDGVDAENPYNETNPHYAENMIFYDGNLTLPNGAVTSNPSKVTMEWLIWCMGKDPRYQGTDYTLPWQ